ncbi:MAG: calcium-translocating P-type ATPase, SERCA-type [Syntrophomonadaceae bacterium]|nr:calcium-translocating P-type ATPase, SERCA-type [Syntrophomonadaceae bacterium]MDD3888325.1 calcium-translocating P-type ATPase, SERCA-type [Syntrophomonadaceae bacterium]
MKVITSWCDKSGLEVLNELGTSIDKGLTEGEIVRRKSLYSNTFENGPRNSPLLMFFNQFTDTMVLVLLGATVISGIIGDMADAITIMAIVIVNAILGFIQEYRAERSLEEIKKLASPYAIVLRNGKKVRIKASDLVPGDIVFLNAGDKIPADLRLLETYNLEIEEAALTGESVPVTKEANKILPEKTILAERENMAFMGTSITRGRALAVVVGTGMRTVMGQIAEMMKQTEQAMTPLQLKLDQLGKILIVICLLVCAIVTFMGILRGEDIMIMLMAGISLAVAAIPEGLPAIVTVVLALGVQRMAKNNAIIRKLPAVETLGCTTVICSDKTGTLTQNKMAVQKIASLDVTLDLEGDGYAPQGRFLVGEKEVNPLQFKSLRLILDVALNCNNASLEKTKGEYGAEGDPTEVAILVMANKGGLTKPYKRIREIPFDSVRKQMSVVIEHNGEYKLFVKGALDVLMSSCSTVLYKDKLINLDQKRKNEFLTIQEQWAEQALRVLGFAYRSLTRDEIERLNDVELEKDLTLLGICGMIDPPRRGVADSVEECLNAGIIPVMITGDHPSTARAIAMQLGIAAGKEVINGSAIDDMSDDKLYQNAIQWRVFARVSPQHKNRIVKVLKKRNHVVAMTGDGVNDAPAVKAADIGIAMGITGTEVTREASSMVLADDNFSTIVKAVYEGRAIYDNIRKFIRYLLGGNIGEVLVMFLASLFGMPLPLLPIQILWVNLITDGLPAMALGLEPPEPGIMNRSPRPRNEGIFARNLGWIILGRGLYIGIITLIAFTAGMIYCRLQGIDQADLPRTMALTTLVFAQLFYVFECRSEKFSPFELGLFKNKFLAVAVLCSITMHICVIYAPLLQQIFHTVPLSSWQWMLILILAGMRMIWKYILFNWQRFFVPRLSYGKINFW